MSDLKQLGDLKKKVEQVQREADRAAGALGETLKRLKAEFGCDSLEEAQTLLKEYQQKESKAKKRFEKAYKSFQEEWKDL